MRPPHKTKWILVSLACLRHVTIPVPKAADVYSKCYRHEISAWASSGPSAPSRPMGAGFPFVCSSLKKLSLRAGIAKCQRWW